MKYYARFKESKAEIIVFNTEKQRDDWVNFRDSFSLSHNNDKRVSTFQRIPLTENQAKYIIKTFGLVETKEKDLNGKTITLFKNAKEGESKIMKKNSKISLQPTMDIKQRKLIAGATVKNSISIGTKRLA